MFGADEHGVCLMKHFLTSDPLTACCGAHTYDSRSDDEMCPEIRALRPFHRSPCWDRGVGSRFSRTIHHPLDQSTHACSHTLMLAHLNTFLHICTHVHEHVHTHTHTHTHTYTHTDHLLLQFHLCPAVYSTIPLSYLSLSCLPLTCLHRTHCSSSRTQFSGTQRRLFVCFWCRRSRLLCFQ